MKAITTSPPFIRTDNTPAAIMGRVLLCLTSLLICSSFYYGARMLVNAAVSVLCCIICEYAVSRMARLPNTVKDLSAVVTGLSIILLLPATTPLWLIALLACFAILIAKAPFGGLGHNPFNPSACAVAFATIGWPELMFKYPSVPQTLPLFSSDMSGVSFGTSVVESLRNFSLPPYRLSDIFFGAVPNKAGTGFFLVIFVCAAFLIMKKAIRWRITASCLAVFILIAFLFPRAGTGFTAVFYELFSGYILFAAVFMITDPATSAKSLPGQYIYGAFCAVLISVMRRYGVYAEGTCFAIIICNAVAPAIDRITVKTAGRRHVINAEQK